MLQSQIAMTPRGTYRSGLETTRRDARPRARVGSASGAGPGSNPLRRSSASPRASSARRWRSARRRSTCCAAPAARRRCSRTPRTPRLEALEIATYIAIERLARAVGDEETARLAAAIRADEEQMLERVLREIPKLTEAVIRADVKGEPSYDLTTTGAADAVREAGGGHRMRRGRRAAAPSAARVRRARSPASRGRREVKGAWRRRTTCRSRATTRSRRKRSPAG